MLSSLTIKPFFQLASKKIYPSWKRRIRFYNIGLLSKTRLLIKKIPSVPDKRPAWAQHT